ncbi:MAG: hypothetical protein AB7F89_23060, partial [Pirellulaceae bacterium]
MEATPGDLVRVGCRWLNSQGRGRPSVAREADARGWWLSAAAAPRAAVWRAMMSVVVSCGIAGGISAAPIPLDAGGYDPSCGIRLEQDSAQLRLTWETGAGELSRLIVNRTGNGRLVREIAVRPASGVWSTAVADVDPVVSITVGSRQIPPGKPADRPGDVFFDNPHRRPHESHAGQLTARHMRLTSIDRQTTLAIDAVDAGPFRGRLEFTIFADSPLIRVTFVMRTERTGLAMLYDAGLVTNRPSWREFAWHDTEDRWHAMPVDPLTPLQPLAVRHRMLIAGADGAALACFSPPHQFQFPRDWTDNLRYVWYGRPGAGDEFGFGIRQNKDGGGNFVPWFNGTPGVDHRLSMFLLIAAGDSRQALDRTLEYTRGDRFAELPGFVTMTSHLHMAIAVTAMNERSRGVDRVEPPSYVPVLKGLGVNLVHLAEFHGDGHQQDAGPLRLPEMAAMFDECRRWSDDKFLLIPGEEVNTFLGLTLEGKHPGHWMSLFPRPVYWTMKRGAEQPFVESVEPYGRVYRVGNRADMTRLIKEEGGLVWSAHPRIKASSWTPDIFRHEDFFQADYWLGGAWKAMPGDLSRERLGERVLNLLDDMANWGHKKYVLGEV